MLRITAGETDLLHLGQVAIRIQTLLFRSIWTSVSLYSLFFEFFIKAIKRSDVKIFECGWVCITFVRFMKSIPKIAIKRAIPWRSYPRCRLFPVLPEKIIFHIEKLLQVRSSNFQNKICSEDFIQKIVKYLIRRRQPKKFKNFFSSTGCCIL